jgi:[ribosomal protein S5]-alanine N-acetyltransferase
MKNPTRGKVQAFMNAVSTAASSNERESNDAWLPAGPIEGLNVRLWCISLKDAPAIAGMMTPDISRWLAAWPPNPTAAEVTQRLRRAQQAMEQKRELHFRIEERGRNRMVGYVSLAQSQTDSKVGQLSYWLGTAFQGKGYMTEAVRLAMAAGFQYLDLDTIEAGAHPENFTSFAVMRRVGMRSIGEKVVWLDTRQQHAPCLFYSIDRSEFQALPNST